MTCDEYRSDLHGPIPDAAERAKLIAHLRDCAACQEWTDALPPPTDAEMEALRALVDDDLKRASQ